MWNQSGICLRFLSAGPGLLSSVSKIKGAAAVGMKPLLLIREGEREELECHPLCPQCCRRDGQLLKSPAVGFPHTWDLPCFTISDKCHLVRIIWRILTVIYYQQITAMLITALSVQKLFAFFWVFFVSLENFYFQQAYCYLTFAILSSVAQKGWLTESRVVGNIGSAEEIILSSFFHCVLWIFFCPSSFVCVCLLVSCYGTHLAPWKIESCF